MDDVTRIEVQAGVHSIFRGSPQYRAIVDRRDIRSHPQYNPDTLINDIGLIYVQNPIPFNSAMQPINLPRRVQANNRFVGTAGTIVGWGRFSDGRCDNS